MNFPLTITNIPIYDDNGQEVAYIEAVKIVNTQFLPNNDEYVMNLIDKRGIRQNC